MATVLLGIGSNLGDRQANIEKALTLLKENRAIEFVALSGLMESRAEGGPPQGDFLNGAIKIKTDLLPLELLSQLKMIERRLGRVKGEPNSPRPMDLDILFYDDVVIVDGKNLELPHPRLAARLFVLKPLLEIAPEWIHPRIGKSIRELYEERVRGARAVQPAEGIGQVP